MLVIILIFQLLIVAWLPLMSYNWLIGFEVLANSLINCLLANFVIIRRLHLNHVLQIIDVRRIKLGVLRVSTPSSKLLVNINTRITRASFRSDLQRCLVGWLHG